MMTVSIPEWLRASKVVPTRQTQETGWFIDYREQQWRAFLKQGLPTQRNEYWKYADLSFLEKKKMTVVPPINDDRLRNFIAQHRLQQGNSILLIFVDGYFVPQFSDMNKLLPRMIACSMKEALVRHSRLIKMYWPPYHINAQYHPFASLNSAVFVDGLFLYLPDDCELSMPIHLLSIATDKHEFLTHPHHLIILGQRSKLTFVEEFSAVGTQQYMINNVLNIILGDEAKLEQVKIQNENKQAIHIAHTFIKQMRNSQAIYTSFSAGGFFSRDDLIVKLQGAGSNCVANGLYHLQQNNQYMDYQIHIDHLSPHSKSQILYKGILNKKSRAVFNGRLYVDKNAQKIIADQSNHHLLLSNEAEAYSKPELEIYADDVKCKHGATTGQIDQKTLFYLRSRGIDRLSAINILLKAFADEIIQCVFHPGIKMRVQKMV